MEGLDLDLIYSVDVYIVDYKFDEEDVSKVVLYMKVEKSFWSVGFIMIFF